MSPNIALLGYQSGKEGLDKDHDSGNCDKSHRSILTHFASRNGCDSSGPDAPLDKKKRHDVATGSEKKTLQINGGQKLSFCSRRVTRYRQIEKRTLQKLYHAVRKSIRHIY